MSIGKRLRQARDELKWTVEQVSDLSGVSERTLARIENEEPKGEYNPKASDVFSLCAVLGVDPKSCSDRFAAVDAAKPATQTRLMLDRLDEISSIVEQLRADITRPASAGEPSRRTPKSRVGAIRSDSEGRIESAQDPPTSGEVSGG